MMENTKDTINKPKWSLLPMDCMEEVVRVFEYGAIKYGKDNWQLSEPTEVWDMYVDAIYRHLVSYSKGELRDLDSGLSHFAHIIANSLILLWFTYNGKNVKLKGDTQNGREGR